MAKYTVLVSVDIPDKKGNDPATPSTVEGIVKDATVEAIRAKFGKKCAVDAVGSHR